MAVYQKAERSQAMRHLAMQLLFCTFTLIGCANVQSTNKQLDKQSFAGELMECPNSPNCVSSLATTKKHQIQPLSLLQPHTDSWAKILEIITSQQRVTVVQSQENYIHVEYRSALFGFVDDLELRLENDKQTVNLRSASRVGYSDLGANRRRVEALRKSFQSAGLINN